MLRESWNKSNTRIPDDPCKGADGLGLTQCGLYFRSIARSCNAPFRAIPHITHNGHRFVHPYTRYTTMFPQIRTVRTPALLTRSCSLLQPRLVGVMNAILAGDTLHYKDL